MLRRMSSTGYVGIFVHTSLAIHKPASIYRVKARMRKDSSPLQVHS